MLNSFSQLFDKARSHAKKRLVLAAAHDRNALEAAVNAYRQDVIDVTLVGDLEKIRLIAEKQQYDIGRFRVIDQPDNDQAAATAVKLVRDGQADILMKGNLATASLLRAVLNKEYGLRSGELISHLALFELTTYHKILGLTDAAMNIAPDLNGKIAILRNAVGYFNLLGVGKPKVAVLGAVETVNPDMKSTVDAAVLSKMCDRGQLKNCIVDGPLAFDNAINEESAGHKCIVSPVAGDADLLLCDNIEVANTLYKSLVYFAKAKAAAVILGAKAPIVLTSRADSDQTKLNSIALAAAVN